MMKSMESLVVWWNSNFPLDKAFRNKYNIPFNSEAHRSTNQIDVLFEFLEDKLLTDIVTESKNKKVKGKMFSDEAEEKHDSDLFQKALKANGFKMT